MKRWVSLAALLLAMLNVQAYAGADRPDGAIPGGVGVPSIFGNATMIGGNDGASYRMLHVDANGVGYVSEQYPYVQTPIAYEANRILASGATPDSSLIPFNASQYRIVYGFFRVRAASVGAMAAVEIAVRGHFSAFEDSTQGWWFPLNGTTSGTTRHGKTLKISDFGTDRFQVFTLADSLTGVPYTAPYMSVNLYNKTGAQIVYDLWFLGVR